MRLYKTTTGTPIPVSTLNVCRKEDLKARYKKGFLQAVYGSFLTGLEGASRAHIDVLSCSGRQRSLL